MDQELLEKISEDLSFYELTEITKAVLSALYRKLRNEEDFGYNQSCLIKSIGGDKYDVDGIIIDDDSGWRWFSLT